MRWIIPQKPCQHTWLVSKLSFNSKQWNFFYLGYNDKNILPEIQEKASKTFGSLFQETCLFLAKLKKKRYLFLLNNKNILLPTYNNNSWSHVRTSSNIDLRWCATEFLANFTKNPVFCFFTYFISSSSRIEEKITYSD